LSPRVAAAVLVLLLLAPACAAAVGFAQVGTFAFRWDGLTAGIRAESLGNALGAAAAGPAAAWWNPGVATRDGRTALAASYTRYDYPDLVGLDYSALAVAADHRNLRASFVQGRLEADSVRLAYLPEGVGEFSETVRLYGLSADLTPWLLPAGSAWRWSLGIDRRTYGGEEYDAGAWDLGTVARWRRGLPGGWIGLRADVAVQNAGGSTLDLGSLEAELREELRLGLACEGALGERPRRGSTLAWLLAYSRHENLGAEGWDRYEGDRVGLEVTLLELLALRGGYNSRPFFADAGFWSWGAGLVMQRPDLLPLALSVDYGRSDTGPFGGWGDHVTVGLRVWL
jgi:hypothetical protein